MNLALALILSFLALTYQTESIFFFFSKTNFNSKKHSFIRVIYFETKIV